MTRANGNRDLLREMYDVDGNFLGVVNLALAFGKVRKNKRSEGRDSEKFRQIGEAQNWRCCYCGRRTVDEPNRRDSATLDHVIPRSRGGANHRDNLVLSCAECNENKGDWQILWDQ